MINGTPDSFCPRCVQTTSIPSGGDRWRFSFWHQSFLPPHLEFSFHWFAEPWIFMRLLVHSMWTASMQCRRTPLYSDRILFSGGKHSPKISARCSSNTAGYEMACCQKKRGIFHFSIFHSGSSKCFKQAASSKQLQASNDLNSWCKQGACIMIFSAFRRQQDFQSGLLEIRDRNEASSRAT